VEDGAKRSFVAVAEGSDVHFEFLFQEKLDRQF